MFYGLFQLQLPFEKETSVYSTKSEYTTDILKP